MGIQMEQALGLSSSSESASEGDNEDTEDENDKQNIEEDIKSKKEDVEDTNSCDMSVIEPVLMKDAENSNSSLAITNILLRRMLLRKELQIKKMEKRLKVQKSKMDSATKAVDEYEALIGFRAFKSVSGVFGRLILYLKSGMSGTKRGSGKAVSSLYQVLAVLLYQLPLHLTMSLAMIARYLGNLMARKAENISNECVERVAREERGLEAT